MPSCAVQANQFYFSTLVVRSFIRPACSRRLSAGSSRSTRSTGTPSATARRTSLRGNAVCQTLSLAAFLFSCAALALASERTIASPSYGVAAQCTSQSAFSIFVQAITTNQPIAMAFLLLPKKFSRSAVVPQSYVTRRLLLAWAWYHTGRCRCNLLIPVAIPKWRNMCRGT